MTQEESHSDQEGHADNRRRRQSGQVTEQGTPLSGRPAGLPARTRPCSPPTLIGVTADEHWVIPRAPTYALLLIANQRPTAPSPLGGGTTSGGRKPAPGPGGGRPSPPHESAAGKRQEPGGTREEAGAGRRARRPSGPGYGRRPARGTGGGPPGVRPEGRPGVPAGSPPGCRPEAPRGTGRKPPGCRPEAHPGSARGPTGGPGGPPGLPPGAVPGAARTPARGCRPEAGPGGRDAGKTAQGTDHMDYRDNPAARAGREPRPRHRPSWQDPRRSRRIRGRAPRIRA